MVGKYRNDYRPGVLNPSTADIMDWAILSGERAVLGMAVYLSGSRPLFIRCH